MGVVVNPFAYALGGGQGVSAGGGGPDGTQYYVEVTIASSEVSSTLTDFPVYVDLSDLPAAFFTNVQSDGGDIRVTESDGTTRCPTELVAIDTGASTGELHFLASSLSSSTDTTYRIYYNASTTQSQPGVATTYGRNAVWGDYVGVWHMGDDPSGTAPQMTDSTGNGLDGTSEGGMTSGDVVAGKVGNALSFDGSNDGIDVSDDPAFDLQTLSVSAWASDSIGAVSAFLAGHASDSQYNWGLYRSGGGMDEWYIRIGGTVRVIDMGTYSNAWRHLVGTYDGTTQAGYADGSLADSTAISGTVSTNSQTFQMMSWVVKHTIGNLDEVRLRGDALSADWIAAEYTNQNTPMTFYTIGSQQAA